MGRRKRHKGKRQHRKLRAAHRILANGQRQSMEIPSYDSWFDARVKTIERSEELKRKWIDQLPQFIGHPAREIIYRVAKRMDCSPITTSRYLKVDTSADGAYFLEGPDLILRLRKNGSLQS